MTLTNPDPTDPLSTPSHASLHVATNNAIGALTTRVTNIETTRAGVAEDIEQARRVSNTWHWTGNLVSTPERPLFPGATVILPVLWNLTPRAANYEAAKATVNGAPAGQDMIIDITVGVDPEFVSSDSIFSAASKLTIPAGANFSPTITGVGPSGFVTPSHNPNVFLQVVILQVGDPSLDPEDAGYDLTVQLNRLL